MTTVLPVRAQQPTWMIWSHSQRGYLGVGNAATTPTTDKAGRLTSADALKVVRQYPADAVALRAPEFCPAHNNALAMLTHPGTATVH